MKLTTLADVRELIGHLPAHVRRKDTWRAQAANGGDLSDVSVALRLVFSIEGIECDV
jgi:hypothetical protein